GTDDAVRSDRHMIHQDAAHTHQHAVSDGAGMQDATVPDADVLAHDGGHVAGEVDGGVVLDVAARADADGVDVGAEDALEKHGRVFAQSDGADQGRVGGDV